MVYSKASAGIVPKIKIRRANLTDAEAIALVVNRSYRPAPGTEGWTHESALVGGERVTVKSVKSAVQDAIVLVGVNESTIVGCVQIEAHNQAAHIGMLAVDPSLQSSGMGKLLLKHAEEFSTQSLNAKEAVLVVIGVRRELIDFYLRRGYVMTNERLRYPTGAGVGVPSAEAMSLVILKKDLTTRAND